MKRINIAYLNEIFCSIQGEGIYIGEPHLFIRFCDCNLHCKYCDTKQPKRISKRYNIECKEGIISKDNPVFALELLYIIEKYFYRRSNFRKLVLTGGEPLLYGNFIYEFLKFYKKKIKNIPVLLETNSTLTKELSRVIDLIDVIAMDIKIERFTGEVTDWVEVKRFYHVAKERECYVKVVFGKEMRKEEMKKVVEIIDDEIDLILQPISRGEKVIVKLSDIERLEKILRDMEIKRYRVIPQIHKVLGVK